MAEAAFHLIQHAFAQRAVGQAQLSNGQRIKHAAQDGQPRHEDRLALVGQPRQAQGVKAFMLQHFFGQQHVRRSGVMRVFFTHRQQHFMGRFDGAGRAQRHVPALNTVLPGQRFQLLRGRHPRAAEVLAGD